MKKTIFNLISVIIISVLTLSGQDKNAHAINSKALKPGKGFAIFADDKLLEISLKLDLKSYLRKDFKEPLNAVLVFHLSETDSLTRSVKVDNRGIFRSSSCFYPPMEISFAKAISAYSNLGKIYKLKLITCCETGNLFEEYVLREYLVYKLYNVLTDSSYRVRLLRVQFIDDQKKRKPFIQYGFFIEPKEILAGRLETAVVESAGPGQKHIIPDVMDRLAIFSYMISNYDWSVKEQHNVTLLQPFRNNTSGLMIAVPHDFDVTGVVNPGYATPKVNAGPKSVRDRTFLGTCRSKEVFRDDLIDFLAKKDRLYRIITDFPYLDVESKKDITDFLDSFFDQIKNQNNLDNLIRIFRKNCK